MSKSKKYYKLPAELLSLPLTPRAMLLYAILADRAELSKKNELFTDKMGSYIIYRIEEICLTLGIGERTAKYALAELEDAGLIIRRKQGRTKPQKIYVQDLVKCKKLHLSEVQKIAPHEVQKIAPHNNNTDYNNTDSSSNAAAQTAAPADTQPTTYLPTLIAMIDKSAAQLGRQIDDVGRIRILNKYRKADNISNPQAWITAVMRNMPLIDLCGNKKDSNGFAATYDIADYESTSVLDEDWNWDDDVT